MKIAVSVGAFLMSLMTIHAWASGDVPNLDTGHQNLSGLVFAPDGDAAWWVAWNGAWGNDGTTPRMIYSSQKLDTGWTAPQAMPFTGEFDDDDPFVSPDGRWLYFTSTRPAPGHEGPAPSAIWRFELDPPHRLERLDVNSGHAEYSPVVTESGALYFASSRPGGYGRGDLYRSALGRHGFLPPENLGAGVNSPTGEWNLWVSPDEREMIFEASSRPSNVSTPGDLYYSRHTKSGWTTAVPLAALNTPGSDLLARPGPGGKTLYFTTAPLGGHARIVTADLADVRRTWRAAFETPLLVANRSSHEVSLVDLAAGLVAGGVRTGEGPHLLSNVDAGRVIATGFGEFPRPHSEPVGQRPPFEKSLNARLVMFGLPGREVLLEVVLNGCARPHASWIVGNHGYVTCEDEQVVLEVDLANGHPLRRFDTRQAGSHVLAFDPGSRTLSVSNTEPGSITLINIDSGDARVISLGGGSEGAVALDGRIWVGNAWQGTVSVVNVSSGEVVHHSEKLCGFPISLSPDAQGQVWVACFGSAELIALDRETFELQRRIELEAQPLNLLLHPRDDIAYVSLPRENAVAEISLHAGEISRRIRVGVEPDGLRWGD